MRELRRVKPEGVVSLSEILAETGRLPPGWQASTEGLGIDCDVDLVRQLSERAATFFEPDEMDPWLAPRLHAALRIPRRVAADDGVWTWLAFHCSQFVEARFKKGRERLHPWRYRGVWSRNALARLWWGAEMTRNGSDYRASEACFRRTRTAQFALELMYSWDRAAAIAFVRVTEGLDSGERLSDSKTMNLSTQLKVLLTLRSLDAFGAGIDEDSEDFDAEWASRRPTFASLVEASTAQLVGPAIGSVSVDRVDRLCGWFRAVSDGVPDEEGEEREALVS